MASHSSAAIMPRDDDEIRLMSERDPIDTNTPGLQLTPNQNVRRQFTVRALAVGLVIGVLIAFSNTYFGLQTGWISGMAMPSALIGFAYFKGLRTLTSRLGGPFKRLGLGEGFSEVENVLVQTVAGSVGTMPLGCGFVGVIPALEFLLKPSEIPHNSPSEVALFNTTAAQRKESTPSGGLDLPLGNLILWALGLCFFGVVFAVPLRKQVIIREKLKFPSGTATALMIDVLHGGGKFKAEDDTDQTTLRRRRAAHSSTEEEQQALIPESPRNSQNVSDYRNQSEDYLSERHRNSTQADWQKQIRLLSYAFALSALYTLLAYFVPHLRAIPFLGTSISSTWLWNFNPSPAYFGQGIIMGPATTVHMLLGAVAGWAILSPLAKFQGWAPGPVDSWDNGSQGWIVWVSLSIMLADAVVSLGWLLLRPLWSFVLQHGSGILRAAKQKRLMIHLRSLLGRPREGLSDYDRSIGAAGSTRDGMLSLTDEDDAPPEHLISTKVIIIGLVLSLVWCIVAIQISFAGVISVGLTALALLLALVLSVMGVRAQGETDLNPVSGISKLTQLIFALVTPPGTPGAVTINLIAGGISEAGALQAGDLLQDLKTGHLLDASPKAQFYGQLIGSAVGAVVSAAVYKLYTHTYKIPGGIFQVPTGFVWIFTARLVTGQGLPPRAAEFAVVAGALWAFLTILRIFAGLRYPKLVPYIPGGIAVAVGMYNTPAFTLTRTLGGVFLWIWTRLHEGEEVRMVVLASGLILGEGIMSIVNLALASARVPHL